MHRLEPKQFTHFLAIFLIVCFIIGIGVYSLIFSHAATPYSSVEAESGLLSGSTAVNTDATASDTKDVQFGIIVFENCTKLPSQLIDLSNWKLTIPTGPATDATEIDQPALSSYESEYFEPNPSCDGVNFTAPIGGSVTSGATHARSELREMNSDGSDANWSTDSGASVMTATESVNKLAIAKPELVFAQIHGSIVNNGTSAYILAYAKAQTDGSVELYVGTEQPTSEQVGVLDSNYTLGTKFSISISAHNDHIIVTYNGVQMVDFTGPTETGCYFKIGDYDQSNPSDGDASSVTEQTTVYSVSVSHT